MVVDAKYKLNYRSSHIHQDIRQVAGYARLKKVYHALKKKASTDIIDCLIIYPCNKALEVDYKFDLKLITEVKAYNQVYKVGIPMPYLKTDD